MTLVKYNPFKPINLDRLFENFAGRSVSDFLDADFVNVHPSVNVVESEKDFNIEVAAPGLSKDDFNVDVIKDALIISVTKESSLEEENDGGKFMRRDLITALLKEAFIYLMKYLEMVSPLNIKMVCLQ